MRRRVGLTILAVIPIVLWVALCSMPLLIFSISNDIVQALPPIWLTLGKLPETVSEVIAIVRSPDGNTERIYIKTDTGKIYYCCERWTEWRLSTPPNESFRSPFYFSHNSGPFNPVLFPEFTHLPSSVRLSALAGWSPEWTIADTRVVVLEDNSVRVWRKDSNIIGLSLLIFIGLTTFIYYLRIGREFDILNKR